MIKFNDIILEVGAIAGNTPTEDSAVKNTVPKITTQQWNRLYFAQLNTLTDDEFEMLQQLSTYLYNRYLTYAKNPKQYNKKLATALSTN